MAICGTKMPTRCNRGFYCRSHCLLNMFRAPLCPSSGAQEYYTAVAACGIWSCGFQVVGLVWSWGLYVQFAGCCSILQTGHITRSSTPDQQLENHSTKYHRQQPLYSTLELLMMGIVVPKTCWASNKICNKNLCSIYLAFYFHICNSTCKTSASFLFCIQNTAARYFFTHFPISNFQTSPSPAPHPPLLLHSCWTCVHRGWIETLLQTIRRVTRTSVSAEEGP